MKSDHWGFDADAWQDDPVGQAEAFLDALNNEPGLQGSDSLCKSLADDFTRTYRDFWDVDPDDYRDSLDLDPSWDIDEARLLRRAWAVLNENTDLVEWAACYVFGDKTHSDCLVDRIMDSSMPVTIDHHVDEDHSFWVSRYTNWYIKGIQGGSININPQHEHWTDYMSAWWGP